MSYQMTELIRWADTGVITGRKLGRAEKLVLLVLASWYNERDHAAYPGASLLGQNSVMDRRSVFRVLAKLEAEGLILRAQRDSASGDLSSNLYGFTPDLLLQCHNNQAEFRKRLRGSDALPPTSAEMESEEVGTLEPPPSDTGATTGSDISQGGSDAAPPTGSGSSVTLNGRSNGTSKQKVKRHRSSEPADDSSSSKRVIDLSPRNGYCPQCFDGRGRILVVGQRCPEHGVVDLVQERPQRKAAAS